jgi:hypothetical protein
MKKLCRFTLESGEVVWMNPLHIRMVRATHAGSRIDLEEQYFLVNGSPEQVASVVEDAVFRP